MNSILVSFNLIFNSHQLIEVGGILLLFAVIYVETGFLLGLVLPGGDYLLFVAGMLCGTHYLDLPVAGLVAILILVSFLGDLTG